MRFSILSTEDDLAALEARWNDLAERSAGCSVFQSHGWQTVWWRIFGKGRDLRLILAEDDERLIGLLPAYVERTDLVPAIGLRKLRLIGHGGDTAPDDLGPILADETGERAVDLLIRGLISIQDEWDVAALDDLHPDCALLAALRERFGGRVEITEGVRISFVELPATFDDYLAKLSANRRWKIRRGRKKLNAHKPYRFELVATREELDRYYPELVKLHHDRWEHRSDDFGFSTAGYVDFHREVMAAMLEKDCLRLMVLINEDGVIAANYCYRWRDGFYFFQGGFSRAYESFRIGEVMMSHAIEQAIREGMAVFDMLRGEHDYKKSLTDRVRTRTDLQLYRPTLRTLSYRTLRAGYRRMRRLRARPEDAHGHAA
ncbi:MAG: GNAT family N-acetyltransferase [Alphaproteobacteria bacterium]